MAENLVSHADVISGEYLVSRKIKYQGTGENYLYLILLKIKLSMQQALKAHRVVRCRVSHIFQTVGSQMAVRLPALSAGRTLHPGRFLVLISVRR
jgi:hypothetical protein